jgi:hypothetical protein
MNSKNCNTVPVKTSICFFAIACVQLASAAPTIVKTTTFAAGAAVKATAPDSITTTRDAVWVAWTNGADSTGKSGTSIVAHYDFSGTLVAQFSFPGYVDGLKYDEERDLIWVLQNQDGNSNLTFIDRNGKTFSMDYAVKSSSRGYDDVVFVDGAIFMSYTNPNVGSDPVIQYMTGVSPATFSTILTSGATGTNLATGQTGQPTSDSDPDSMKITPFNGLMLTSGADGQVIFVYDLFLATRSVGFLNIIDPGTSKNVSGLDDVVWATTPSGTFYVADTGNNQVLKVEVNGLTPMSLFASSGSSVSSVNMKTGVATPFITNLNAPHGLVFLPNVNSLFGAQP